MQRSITAGLVTVFTASVLAASPATAGKPASAPGIPINSHSSPGATHRLRGVDALSSNDAWAVGTRSIDGSHDLTWISHLDGSHWASVPSPSPGNDASLRRVKAISDTDVWAVGTVDTYDPVGRALGRRRLVCRPASGGRDDLGGGCDRA